MGQRRIVGVCQEPAFDKHGAVYRFAQDIKPRVFYPAIRAVCCRHHMPLDRTRQGSFSGRCEMRADPASSRTRGSVEMDADEDRFGVRVRDLGTGAERDKRVVPPGQDGFEACSLERVVQAQGDIQSDALFRNEILRDSAKIVSAVSGIARSLSLSVVAEGVETEPQAQLLRLLRCDQIQGFLISPAVPAGQAEAFFSAPTQDAPLQGDA